MQLPDLLLDSLESVKGFDRESFVQLHESGKQVTSIRINPYKVSMVNGQWAIHTAIQHSPLTIHQKIPWTELGFYLPQRPSFTFDPLFHAGCYYVQEASSMFLEQAFKQMVDLSQPLRVLDLCAAPGGKSTHILSLISKDSLLVSNEVIRSRANILNDNIVKWGCNNGVVSNNDPRDFQRLKDYFDVIVVDAPCSGSGLFRREPEAIEEWSEPNVMLCSQRQQRILADALPSLKSGGLLIYSTCSYSKTEDEDICSWLESELKVKSQKLKVKSDWKIVESDKGYRFWPDKLMGEGFFIACFTKCESQPKEFSLPKGKADKFSKQEIDILKSNVIIDGLSFFKYGKIIHSVDERLLADVNFLSSKLRFVNTGTRIGQIMKDKLVPDHGLAMSNLVSKAVGRLELNYESAIQYLKKKEFQIEAAVKGWNLAAFEGHPLGWINILPNRFNNYYPKELRILKD